MDMSSALKPVLTPGGPQNPPAPSQMNKPLLPQAAPTTYGQPNPYNMANAQHGAAHNPPANAHSSTMNHTSHPNHYSLNVPNAPQHFAGGIVAPTIPVSNHPVASASQGQVYSPTKGAGNYQPNLGHPPNVIPPATQSLPATNHSVSTTVSSDTEKTQANGVPETKTPPKVDVSQNHVAEQKDKPLPSPVPMLEKANPSPEKVTVVTVPPVSEPKVIEAKPAEVPSVATISQTTPVISSTVPAIVPPSVTITPAVPSNTSASIPEVKTLPIVEAAQKGEESPTASPAQNSPPSPSKSKEQVSQQKPSSPLKLATTIKSPSTKRSKTKEEESPKPTKSEQKPVASTQKTPYTGKRNRIQTQPYQSPLPEFEIISKLTNSVSRSSDEKLIVFYKNEFLAVRNSEGSFYVCQAVQNIYKSSPKIRIRWLSQDKNDKTGEIYTPDFYDFTDFDCILTNLNLVRIDKGKYKLPAKEKVRTDSILKRAIAVEKGDATPPSLTEEHPDGIDLSLYKEESQLKKRRGRKRKASNVRGSPKAAANKSPERAKVQKLSPKSATPKQTKKKVVAAKKPPIVEPKKKPALPVRAERAAKRKISETISPKTSPVVDQKKAKVLAKVARKATPKPKPQVPTKSVKPTKSIAPPPKAKKVPPAKTQMSTRKAKRPSRK